MTKNIFISAIVGVASNNLHLNLHKIVVGDNTNNGAEIFIIILLHSPLKRGTRRSSHFTTHKT